MYQRYQSNNKIISRNYISYSYIIITGLLLGLQLYVKETKINSEGSAKRALNVNYWLDQ